MPYRKCQQESSKNSYRRIPTRDSFKRKTVLIRQLRRAGASGLKDNIRAVRMRLRDEARYSGGSLLAHGCA